MRKILTYLSRIILVCFVSLLFIAADADIANASKTGIEFNDSTDLKEYIEWAQETGNYPEGKGPLIARLAVIDYETQVLRLMGKADPWLARDIADRGDVAKHYESFSREVSRLLRQNEYFRHIYADDEEMLAKFTESARELAVLQHDLDYASTERVLTPFEQFLMDIDFYNHSTLYIATIVMFIIAVLLITARIKIGRRDSE